MEQQVIINIHGYPIVCNLFFASRNASRFNFSGGQINIQVKKGTPLLSIKHRLERSLSVDKVAKMNSSLYIGDDYVDILGQRKHLVVLEEGKNAKSIQDIIVKKRDDVETLLKSYALEIITKEVRRFEKIMEIPIEYQIKITDMRACLGKNYYKKGLLTFDKDLIHYSMDIIDSVVIHELAHYFYQNHSKNFYNKVLFYCPDYKELSKKLAYGVRK